MRDQLSDYAHERDRAEFNLSGTLDVKTVLILICLMLLAIQSSDFIRPCGLPLPQSIAQGISVLYLVGGGVLSVCVLWPRSYAREAAPDKYETWLVEWEKARKAKTFPEPSTDEMLRLYRLSVAMDNVRDYSAINKTKSKLMFWALYCFIVSFAANMATLVMRLFLASPLR